MENKYKTCQRKKIKDYLIENEEKFISAEEIREYLKEKDLEVGLTTIYRYLKYLEENNSVRTDIKEHTKYYQIISDECSNHYHLKCKKCGKTVHLDCKEFEEANEHISIKHKFKIDHNTIIYGICEKCYK